MENHYKVVHGSSQPMILDMSHWISHKHMLKILASILVELLIAKDKLPLPDHSVAQVRIFCFLLLFFFHFKLKFWNVLFKFKGKSTIYRDTQHPQGVAGLEKIQEVEDAYSSKYLRQPSAPEAEFPKPVFIIPLEPEVLLTEGQPLHLEAQVEPRTDPDLKIEWYFNGKALVHGM